MSVSLSARDRRAVGLGLVLVLPAILFGAVAAPYFRALSEVRTQIGLERDLLAREMAAISEAPAYPGLIQDAATALGEYEKRMFSGPDTVSATAALGRRVGQEAVQHRVLIERSETRIAEGAGPGIVTLQIALSGRSDLEGILGLLHGLEGGARLVRVEEISIEQPQRLSTGFVPEEEVLLFSAIVSGYGLGGGSDDVNGFGIVTIGGGA